jgi:hypothetical protein
MDLRQYLIAPHERYLRQHDNPTPYHQQQPAVRTFDPRLIPIAVTNTASLLNYDQPPSSNTRSHIEIGSHDERSQLSQQLSQQNLPDGVVTREQVIRGLTAYPDILAAILRSNHILDRTSSDTGSSRHHINTPSTASQVSTSSSHQIDTTTPFQQTTCNPAPIAASAPALPPPSTTPLLCFWYYHRGHCVNDPTSPTYKSSDRPCPFLHSTDGMQEIRVQPGKETWHRRIGDCGLELCRFSSNYKHTEEIELNLQQKKDYRKWKSEVKRQARIASLAEEGNMVEDWEGRGSGESSERRVEDRDVGPSSQSNISHGEQNDQETAPTTHSPIIPTSPKAGRYAKGSRAQQTFTLTPISTPPTLKRKGPSHSNQDSPTPTPKKLRIGPTIQTTTSGSILSSSLIPPLTKSAAKRLKRLAKTAIDKSSPRTQSSVTSPHGINTVLSTTIKPLEIFPYTTSPPSNPTIIPPSLSHTNKSPAAKTCFAWYHNTCPKRGKKCKDLHALTQPPSFVVTPVGYVHEEGVCGRDWCSGDWRGEVGDGVRDEEGNGDEWDDDEERIEDTWGGGHDNVRDSEENDDLH